MKYPEFKKLYREIWNSNNSDNPNKSFANAFFNAIELNTNKKLSDNVLYALWFFYNHKFTGTMTINNSSKTEFIVKRDNVADTFTLTATHQNPQKCDIKSYMDQFEKSFNLKCEIERLKAVRDRKP